jgi:hypothetical protein
MAIQSIGTRSFDSIDPSDKPAQHNWQAIFLEVTLEPANQHKTWQPVGFEIFNR